MSNITLLLAFSPLVLLAFIGLLFIVSACSRR